MESMNNEDIDFIIETLEVMLEWADDYTDSYFKDNIIIIKDKNDVIKAIEILKAQKEFKSNHFINTNNMG